MGDTGGHMFNRVAELAVCSAALLLSIWSCTHYYDAMHFPVI